MTKDFESLLFISQILTDTTLDEMSQLTAIKKVMYSWTLNLKRKAKEATNAKDNS